MKGKMDEFRIIKSVGSAYTGIPATYTIPTVPYDDPSPTTELYMMDGSGTETKLT